MQKKEKYSAVYVSTIVFLCGVGWLAVQKLGKPSTASGKRNRHQERNPENLK
jgi:hypothetical protein